MIPTMSRRCRLLSSDNIEFGLREGFCSDFVETLVSDTSDQDACISVPFPSSSVLEFLKDLSGTVMDPSVMEIRSVLGVVIMGSEPNQTILSDILPEDDSENLNNNLGDCFAWQKSNSFAIIVSVTDDTSEYLIKVEVANESIMNASEDEVTQEYVSENTMLVAVSEGPQENHQQESETTNLHLQNMSLCEEGTSREPEINISPETPYHEEDTSLINPYLMTTGMRVGGMTSFRDELDIDDLCEINIPEYSFSEIVDEVLNDDGDNNGLLETIETFTNKCRSEGATRRLTFTIVDDSVAENKRISVQCQMKGVPKIKDLKKVKKNKRNGRRRKGV